MTLSFGILLIYRIVSIGYNMVFGFKLAGFEYLLTSVEMPGAVAMNVATFTIGCL